MNEHTINDAWACDEAARELADAKRSASQPKELDR